MAKAKSKAKKTAAKPKAKAKPGKAKKAKPRADFDAPESAKSDRIQRVLDQAKEPLGLLETLKEEGMARAGYLLGIAAEMSKQVTMENVSSQIRDVSGAVGIASKEEVRKLKERITELEERIELLEAASGLTHAVASSDDEDEEEEEEEALDAEEDAEEEETAAEDLEEGELFEEQENAEELDPEDLN